MVNSDGIITDVIREESVAWETCFISAHEHQGKNLIDILNPICFDSVMSKISYTLQTGCTSLASVQTLDGKNIISRFVLIRKYNHTEVFCKSIPNFLMMNQHI